jgi:hypothetical protein
MTQILEKAWKTVLNLPEDRQELIAYMILDEIQDERLWEKKFDKSQEKLSLIADKVRKDIRLGRVHQKGFGAL